MQRITLTMDDALAEELDAFIKASGGGSRSEAIRDLLRQSLGQRQKPASQAPCLGVISYTIDHNTRDLGRRVPQGRLARHDQTISALSVPIDHDSSLDVVVMRAPVEGVQDYAQALFMERGLRHGSLSLIPLHADDTPHSHDEKAAGHHHHHVRDTF